MSESSFKKTLRPNEAAVCPSGLNFRGISKDLKRLRKTMPTQRWKRGSGKGRSMLHEAILRMKGQILTTQ